MRNRKIVFANQKGGVGKSTLCILFANYLAWKKQQVCVIDTDLQKTIKMQRKKDMDLYPTLDPPYEVQDFDVQAPDVMQQLMDSCSSTRRVMFPRMAWCRCSPMPISLSVLTSMRKRLSTPLALLCRS